MKIIKLRENLYINASNLCSIFIQKVEHCEDDYNFYIDVKYTEGNELQECKNILIGRASSCILDSGCIFCNDEVGCPSKEDCDKCKYNDYLNNQLRFTPSFMKQAIQQEIEELLTSIDDVIDFSSLFINGCFINGVDDKDKAIYEIYNKAKDGVIYRTEYKFPGFTESTKYKKEVL